MVKVFHSDARYDFTMKAIMLVVVIVLSLSVLIPPLEAKRLKIEGNSVSSGEFYDVVVHNYTVALPPLVEARDAEKLYGSLSIDRARWKLEDEDGQIFDYTSRIKYAQERFNETLSRGTLWDVSIKIKKVTMTDTTHGAVLWILVTDWENEDRTRSGRASRRYVTHWEKIDGKWLVVAAKQGKSY